MTVAISSKEQRAALRIAYLKSADDSRKSDFFEVDKLLQENGAQIWVYDSSVRFKPMVESLERVFQSAQAVVIVTSHENQHTSIKKNSII